jgi:predicted RecA/RadA family phage recombinase
MKNFIQAGDTITATAPSGGISSGAGMLMGSLFGVAAFTAEEGDPVEIKTTGVFELPKTSGDTPAAGDLIYWDGAADEATTNSGSDEVLIGAATEAAGGGDAVVRVRLNGTTVV